MRWLVLALIHAATAPWAAGCTNDAMLVFDASGSMAEMGYNGQSTPRIAEARDALHVVLPEVAPWRRIGLITYGPGEHRMCENVALRLPPQRYADSDILAIVDTIDPRGNTALTDAVDRAVQALDGTGTGTVVLVTDGKETCGGAPCSLARDLRGSGITVHVIGFRVAADAVNWKGGEAGPEDAKLPTIAQCLADETGGLYVSANSLQELIDALQKTLACNQISLGPALWAPPG